MKASYFAVATVVATFALLVVGGTVNPTGSSLACPDWPLCHGQVFPKMEGGVLYEHTHRLVATLVGLMTCILAVLLWRRRHEDRTLALLGGAAVAAVILQGVLGGLTVLFRLPTAISIAHLALSMLFFTLLLYITVRSWQLTKWRLPDTTDAPSRAATARSIAAIAWFSVFLQMLLGAMVRHTGAGHVCGTDPFLCEGVSLWPGLQSQQLHMLHRFLGVCVSLWVVAAAIALLRNRTVRRHALTHVTTLVAPWLALQQVLLGVVSVATGIAVLPVTAHLALGALMLASFSLIYFVLDRLPEQVGAQQPLTAANRRLATEHAASAGTPTG